MYEQKGWDYKVEIDHFMRNGYVFINPEYVLIAKACYNVWWIHLAIGKNCFAKFLQHMPYRLPYVAWIRPLKNDKHSIYTIETIERWVNYDKQKS